MLKGDRLFAGQGHQSPLPASAQDLATRPSANSASGEVDRQTDQPDTIGHTPVQHLKMRILATFVTEPVAKIVSGDQKTGPGGTKQRGAQKSERECN